MKAFEIYVNGKKVCTAGFEDRGIVTAGAHWVKRRDEVVAENPYCVLEEIQFEVGAQVTNPGGIQERLQWVRQALSVGDEITLRVVDAKRVSRPKSRRRTDPLAFEKHQRRYYERLKKEYGD